MTVVHLGDGRYKGLAADTKPTAANTAVGAIFHETDTGNEYRNSGSAWAYVLPHIGQPTQTWSVYYSGTTIHAKNNKTGLIVYTDASGNINTVLASIIGAISPAGTPTSIEIGEGDFNIAAAFTAISSGRVGNIRIKGQGIGLTNLVLGTGITGSGMAIDIAGAVSGTGKNLTANATVGSWTLTVSTSDSATFAVGDYVLLRSTKLFSTSASQQGFQGEIHRITAINTGTGVITLDNWTMDTYNTADTSNIIKLAMLQNITLEDFTIKHAVGYTGTGALLRCNYINNLKMKNIELIDPVGQFWSGFRIQSCTNFDLNGLMPVLTPAATKNDQYGVCLVAACQNGRVFLQARGQLRHSFTVDGVSGTNVEGAVRNIVVSGTSEATAESHFDTHSDGDGIVFNNCNIVGNGQPLTTSTDARAFSMRCKNVTITNCNIKYAVGRGITLSEDAHGTIIKGNQINSTLFTQNGTTAAYAISISTGILGTTIEGNQINNTGSLAIFLQGTNTDTIITNNVIKASGEIRGTNTTDVVMTGNRISNGANKALNMTGTSDRWVIVGNSAQGSATSTFVGAGNVKAENINL